MADPFSRTVCDCAECQMACRHAPAYLVPGDVERIAAGQGQAPGSAWVLDHFAASDGPLVQGRGAPFHVPTIIPAQRADGSCVFLDEAGRCTIHAIAPYGCRFFDSHQPKAESDRRSLYGLR